MQKKQATRLEQLLKHLKAGRARTRKNKKRKWSNESIWSKQKG